MLTYISPNLNILLLTEAELRIQRNNNVHSYNKSVTATHFVEVLAAKSETLIFKSWEPFKITFSLIALLFRFINRIIIQKM